MLCSLSVCSRHMGSPRQWLPHQGDKETRHTVKTGRSFSNSLDKVITLYVVWLGIWPLVRHVFTCDIMSWKAEEIAAVASRSLQGWTPCLLWRLKLWPVSASNWLVFTSYHYNTENVINMLHLKKQFVAIADPLCLHDFYCLTLQLFQPFQSRH